MTEQTTPMMLEIADLEVRYGGIRALHHLSLKVPQGRSPDGPPTRSSPRDWPMFPKEGWFFPS